MAINIYTVQADLEQQGWKLISDQYKNLKTPLSMECPKGHSIEMAYEDWRKNSSCPSCKRQEAERTGHNIIRSRADGVQTRVLVLDAATGTTGWAIYDDRRLTAYGTFTTMRDWEAHERIHQFIGWLDKNIQIWEPDVVGIEGIQLEDNVRTFQTLANLQGAVVEYLMTWEYPFLFAAPATWRGYIGLPREKREGIKKKTQAWVHMMFGFNPTEDEADAVAMGQYFISHFGKKNAAWGEDI